MKTLSAFIFVILFSSAVCAQTVIPDVANKHEIEVHNRDNVQIIKNEQGSVQSVQFDAKSGDGFVIFKNIEFENGTLELDIKGKNNPGRSFVGIAFHIQDEETFNAVYFRPFNFKNPDKIRSGHSVQYISHPEFTWSKLRSDFPEEFENAVNPVPDPDKYFHAKVVVEWPMVSVFVDDAEDPSLKVKMKSAVKKGKVGFWVGNGSDGDFKNLVVINK